LLLAPGGGESRLTTVKALSSKDIVRSAGAIPLERRPLNGPAGAASACAANLLSLSRVVLGAVWIALFVLGHHRPETMVVIAVSGAASDFLDGRVARRTLTASNVGRWLDNVCDIVFILSALGCAAFAGIIPVYIPLLIAVSFAQYVADSVVIRGSAVPIKSRLGHWGGILNYILLISVAWAPAVRLVANWLQELSPLVAFFYLAAMFERILSYHVFCRNN
jgi:phosphatidylglycerophosphate synthase